MEYHIYGSLKGDLRAKFEVAGDSHKTAGNVLDAGDGTFETVIGTRAASEWRNLKSPWRNTIVVMDGDRVEYAGVILENTWTPSTRRLQLKTREFPVFLGVRLMYGVGEYARGSRSFVNRSLRGIAIESIWHALSTGVERWNLPISVPASESGPLTETCWAWDFATAAEWLDSILQREGAPILDFEPRVTDGKLMWHLRAGKPRIQESSVKVNLAAGKHPVTNLSITESGLRQVTGLIGVGNGSGKATIHADANEVTLPGWTPVPDMPYVDATLSLKDEKDAGRLQQRAKGELSHRVRAKVTAKYDWLAGGLWPRLRPHMQVTVEGDDPMMGAWSATGRVKSVTSDYTNLQKLELI
ncbi:hypothetical protein JRG19_02590 [Pseudoclavibacter alba]|uniref:hypothetical protein n=1 Tax=Pseudoclavibacter albus TaxID=272241 RepID=UPI0019D289E2|nr:hypothetical protein [Pseudoclavibacter alba]MBN6777438.1 hypothetical protein [Pseudoclavibacter alba]